MTELEVDNVTKEYLIASLDWMSGDKSGLIMEKFTPLDPTLEKIELKIDVLPVISDNGLIFIPVGTKDIPKGVSLFENNGGKYLFFSDLKTYFKVLTIDELKNLLKTNRSLFDKTIGADFETMGFVIKVDDFLSLTNIDAN